jgi:hypothetical protein
MSTGPDEPSGDSLDLDEAFGEDVVDDILDTSYSPGERPRGMDAFGTTAEEARRGETLEQRIAQEEPEHDLENEDEDEEDQDEQADAGGSVGGPRSGRLVAPDEGLGRDDDKDLVGFDVGIDAGAASAEEAAVHVISDEEALAEDFDEETQSMLAQWRDDS